MYRTVCCLLIGIAALTASSQATASTSDAVVLVRWQVVSADEHKVGHARITRITSATEVQEVEQIELELGGRERHARYRATLETVSAPDGSLRSIAREIVTSEARSRVEARAVGDALQITQRAGNRESTQRLEGAARGLLTKEAARPWLASVGAGAQPVPFSYRTWDPVKLTLVDVELSVRPGDPAANVERRVRGGPEVTASLLRADARGNVIHEILRLDAFTIVRSDAPESRALAANDAFDHVATMLVQAPYRIPARDMDQKIRYRFDNGGRVPALPAGAGQRTWTEGQTTWIQVCASCPLEAVALAPQERARALAVSQWLQSDDDEIRTRALRLTRAAPDAAQAMQRLTAFVREHMDPRVDMLGYGTAVEALRTRRGDCTEYAVLLAALGRAAGIPTRIAIGRVYARHFESAHDVFVPHAWVQAWTGAGWQNFDAGTGVFDSTHLAFALSYDGSPLTHAEGLALSRELKLTAAARVAPPAAAP